MNRNIKQTSLYFVYPLTIFTAFLFYYFFQLLDLNLAEASLITVCCIGVIIHILEQIFPYRSEWNGNDGQVKTDGLHMAISQLITPKITTLAVMGLTYYLLPSEIIPKLKNLWPHNSPILAQVCLMLVVAELFRYWLHRFSHTIPLLWRLHSVHHSCTRLWWFNVGRFHPLEKFLQFFTDSFVFLLVGVSQDVFAVYFVFYATNGFLQHSNVNQKLGFLNYIVSSAQLHRFHHSYYPKESNNNYGNNLIIWDLVFNSFYLPKDKEVGGLGLKNKNYPQGYLDHLKAPFIPRITEEQ